MTIQFKCNGPECSRVMGKDEYRIFLGVHEPPQETVGHTINEEGVEYDFTETTLLSFDSTEFLGDKHFCSPTCLTAWGYAEALERMAES